jgi:hypothetical protein
MAVTMMMLQDTEYFISDWSDINLIGNTIIYFILFLLFTIIYFILFLTKSKQNKINSIMAYRELTPFY